MQDPTLVLGASGALGAAIARRLVADGNPVILHGRRPSDRLDALAEELGMPSLCADLTVEGDVTGLVDAVGDGLSGLVFAAAAPFPHKLTLRTDWSVFQTQVDSQLKALHLTMVALKPVLEKRPDGARVVVVSTEYVQGQPPIKIAPYVAAKSALTAYAKVLAQEVLKLGIRVHILAPGLVPAGLNADLPQEYLDMIAQDMPEKILTSAEDVANLCAFLLNRDADPLYGTVVPVTRAPRR